MNKKTLLLFSFVLLGFSLSGKAQDKPQTWNSVPDFKTLGVDESRLERIDRFLQGEIDKGALPHALTFIAKNGQIIHHKAFGWRNAEQKIPLKTDDIFRMYSQTKAIVTTALLTLFEQGKFQLDDPVSQYIPEMTDQVMVKTPEGNVSTRKAASPVTIRHLLSHSAGINPRNSSQNTPATLEEYVKDLVKNPLLYDPGTDWNYHPSLDVVAYLVEYFSGESLQTYLKKNIFDPLGIKDMAYYYPTSYRERFVSIYRAGNARLNEVEMWSGRNPFDQDTRFAQGGTGLNGTIEGYARFCQMILNGGVFNGNRILGRRTVEMMMQNQLAIPNSGGEGFLFGLGFQIYQVVRGKINNFTPMVNPGSLNWGGMANTDYLIDPKDDLIILLYTNRIPDYGLWEKFLNTVYQALE